MTRRAATRRGIAEFVAANAPLFGYLALVALGWGVAVLYLVYSDARARGADDPDAWVWRVLVFGSRRKLREYLRRREQIGERTTPLGTAERAALAVVVVAPLSPLAAGVVLLPHPVGLFLIAAGAALVVTLAATVRSAVGRLL